MKPNASHLEILLFTNTSISKRQLTEKNSELPNITISPAEELEKQCWAGVLPYLLPEFISPIDLNRDNYIWSIRAENNFINISIGACPQVIATCTSLDPHYFLTEKLMS